MAAARTMFAVAREEAAILTTEIAATARVEATRAAEEVVPVARQAVQTEVKTTTVATEPSLLAQHLAHAPLELETVATAIPRGTANSLSMSAAVPRVESVISRTIEMDTGGSLREVLSNAVQTGAQEHANELVEAAQAMMENPAVQGAVAKN